MSGLHHAPPPPAASVASLVYTAEEVAQALGLKPDTFRKKRPALEAAGFPKRLPAMGSRWSRAAVDAFVAAAGVEG